MQDASLWNKAPMENIATKPTVAISIGDPAGIGPEVTFKALTSRDVRSLANWVVVGNVESFAPILGPNESIESLPGVSLLSVADAVPKFKVGRVAKSSGLAALAYIREATRLCLQCKADAMVTGPVNKEAIRLSTPNFTGHTDYIAKLCGVSSVRMLLVNEKMRVLHVTTHCSLRSACASSSRRINDTIRMGHGVLRQLGLSRRRIAVCGLNPHAGEHGAFGHEEENYIAPAIAAPRRARIDCPGPFPADT